MSRDRVIFDPDTIQTALRLNAADAFRALAEAIDAKQIDFTLASVEGNGWGNRADDRIHVIARIGLAAECELDPQLNLRTVPPKISLPATAASETCSQLLTATTNEEALLDAIRTGFWDTALIPQPLFEAINGAVLARLSPVQTQLDQMTERATKAESETEYFRSAAVIYAAELSALGKEQA